MGAGADSIRSSETLESRRLPHQRLLDAILPARSRSTDRSSESVHSSNSSIGTSSKEEERERKNEVLRAFEREVQMRRRMSAQKAEEIESCEEKARYGQWDVYHTEPKEWKHLDDVRKLNSLAISDPEVMEACVGSHWSFRVRIHAMRNMSAHLAFVVLREHGITMQAVLTERGTGITPHMMHWVMRLPVETLLFVRGVMQKPVEVISGCDITHLELKLTHVHVVSEITESLPFTVYAAERSVNSRLEEHQDLDDAASDQASAEVEPDQASQRSSVQHGTQSLIITQRTRLTNRLIDLRTPTMQATFKIQSVICREFRNFLNARDFTEIHTPKLQGGASESGASVFQVNYFGRSAFLAQSPQLYKQMCIASDMRRVFEIGPVFRAENSNTPRHMTEYTGLDIEMEINHYYDALSVIDGMLKHIFKVLHNECQDAIQQVRKHFNVPELVWLDQTLVLHFSEGIRMLKEAGYREEDGSEPDEFEDLHTRAEIRLGELVKEKYGTDYYVLDKFPRNARPFYALCDPKDERRTNTFDIFVRGQEICTGGQRIHRSEMLEENIRRMGIDSAGLEEYLEGFRLGAPPHAGCGIGLERLVMLYLNLDDIRLASLFYRDPKSFAVKAHQELRHPDAGTNPPPWLQSRNKNAPPPPKELQPLEHLIANYGDSTNTSWLDDRIKVWRHPDTGAAVGYTKRKHNILVVGNPLCDHSQYENVISKFLEFCRLELQGKPIWLMVSESVEGILGGRHGWCTLTCTADQRIKDVRRNPAKNDHEIQRKIRHANKVGVSIQEVAFHQTVPEDVKKECDARIQEWQRNRKGMQVHLTDVRPWVDEEHRAYYLARDENKKVCCMVVFAQLAPSNGYQVKWAISFPNAPNGAIEMTILHALDMAGSNPITFGTAAASKVEAVHGLSGIAFKMLSRVYNSVADRSHLQNKSDFREKLGTVRDPTYICYPKGGMTMLAVRDLIEFFRE
ncbi:aspartyl-trna cytoplasmic [Malassezia pachydermatis]|uniref:Probable aspartate--tRNA ligase, cytoplasmic n=1 Tax=Malassezia pachydermatis TaxID=77020 RepID=A0A0N0RRU6_9BASI|nr:aspartyl-trna cytoplasmic [Malassezia pachydermatis]KOS12529.1 aspartyl-trna cytoplasmic [Malassezia pachydermatis]